MLRRALVLAVILCVLACAVVATILKPTFTAKDEVYRIPLKVGQYATTLSEGDKAAASFAYKQREKKIWTYAFTNEKVDPKTEESIPTSEGRDLFIRWTGEYRAQISVSWKPMSEKTLVALHDEDATHFSTSPGVTNIGTVKRVIGGYPALGTKFLIEVPGSRSRFTLWNLKATQQGREFSLGFEYETKLKEPAEFNAVLNGIRFLDKN